MMRNGVVSPASLWGSTAGGSDYSAERDSEREGMAVTDNPRRLAYTGRGGAWLFGGLVLVSLLGCTGRNQSAGGGGGGDQATGSSGESLPMSAQGTLPLAGIQGDAKSYLGKSVSGTGAVAEVVSGRAFWVEADATQLFVVKDDPLVAAPKLTAGQQITLKGTVNDPATMKQVPAAAKLEAAAQKMLEGQPAYILATEITATNP